MDAEEKSIRERLSHPSVDRSVGYAEQQAPISVRQADHLLAELDALRERVADLELEQSLGWSSRSNEVRPNDA